MLVLPVLLGGGIPLFSSPDGGRAEPEPMSTTQTGPATLPGFG